MAKSPSAPFLFSSSRFHFREIELSDRDYIFLLNEDPEVLTHTGDAPFKDLAAAEVCIIHNIRFQYEHYGFGRWAVIDKNKGDFLGWCGLKYRPERDTVDLGYRFFKKYWGQGYATEASIACLQYGHQKLKLPTIIATARKSNPASIRVLEKAGMQCTHEADLEGFEAVWFESVLDASH